MFGPPWILGLILGLAAVASLWDVVSGRRELFDARLTANDRNRLLRFVIFVLLPLSIVFHEAGHAVAVRLLGGEVIDFGFYFFYGYVQHQGFYTPVELGWIALAGTLVNVALAAVAFGIFWFAPRRPAVSYVLFTFGVMELANALVFYPLLDFVGGIVGDWTQIYRAETPVFSVTVAVTHVGLLVGAWLIWKNAIFQAGYRRRIGLGTRSTAGAGQRDRLTVTLAEAASAASAGWKHPVEIAADAQGGGFQMILRWRSGGFLRGLVIHATPAEGRPTVVELHAAVQPEQPGLARVERPLTRIEGEPNTRELTGYIRQSLDTVDLWDGESILLPN